MKALLLTISILFGVLAQPKEKPRSIWKHKITSNCINTLKLYSFGKATEYDCEMDYTFHCTYKLLKDTLLLTIKDDSHSEDGGKVKYYKDLFIIHNKTLNTLDGKIWYE